MAHVWAAYTLSRADLKARPVKYQARRKGGFATSTMRWGGVILLLFIVYHILDLTTGTLNPSDADHPYQRTSPTSSRTAGTSRSSTRWRWARSACTSARLWSAANTLGWNRATTASFRTLASVVAVAIAVGFLVIPFSVVFGLVD